MKLPFTMVLELVALLATLGSGLAAVFKPETFNKTRQVLTRPGWILLALFLLGLAGNISLRIYREVQTRRAASEAATAARQKAAADSTEKARLNANIQTLLEENRFQKSKLDSVAYISRELERKAARQELTTGDLRIGLTQVHNLGLTSSEDDKMRQLVMNAALHRLIADGLRSVDSTVIRTRASLEALVQNQMSGHGDRLARLEMGIRALADSVSRLNPELASIRDQLRTNPARPDSSP